jgi:phenylpropionate dioxygenase-like ring-hydroxylating dioxygenase large terminal subunit
LSEQPWHPVALSTDVPIGVTRGVTLENREIVLWRGGDGAIHAWNDRCPHRGMRLSYGFVRGGSLNCLYHGWEYEGSSRCIRIPAHPDLEVPKTIRATAYGARETGGLIWMTLDSANAFEPPASPPAVPLITTAINRPIEDVRAFLGHETSATVAVRDGFILALHKATDDKTLLHALALGDGDDPAFRKAAAAKVRELRRQAEALAVEAA